MTDDTIAYLARVAARPHPSDAFALPRDPEHRIRGIALGAWEYRVEVDAAPFIADGWRDCGPATGGRLLKRTVWERFT